VVYLVYRYDKNVRLKGGPYAVRSVRPGGSGTPRQEYLGPAVVKLDGTIGSKRTGEGLGVLRSHNTSCSETHDRRPVALDHAGQGERGEFS